MRLPGSTTRVLHVAVAALMVATFVAAAPSAPAAPMSMTGTSTRDARPDLDFEGTTSVDGIGEVLCNLERPRRLPVLHLGTRYEGWTKLAQAALLDLGYRPGPVDGDFGPRTERAVREFQADRGIVVDGRVGARTWTALKRAWC